MIKLSPAREAELLADYKARVAAKEEANDMLDKMRADQKAKDAEFYKPHIIQKTKTLQKCAGCNCTLPIGSKAVLKSKIVNVSRSGYTAQMISQYLCCICSGQLKKVDL
jgi:hypothetical protein